MGRWVCLRCFESNEEAVVACANCGLARGATPPPSDQEADPTSTPAGNVEPWAQPEPPQNRFIGLLRRFGWLAVVAVILVAGWWFSAGRNASGEISRSGNLSVSDLHVGDCFDLKDPDAETIGDVDAKVCSEPHQYEMMFIGDLTGSELPTEEAMQTWVADNCLPAFRDFVGVAWQNSALDVFWVVPSQESWDDGDHSIQCAVFDPANAQLTTSLSGANR